MSSIPIDIASSIVKGLGELAPLVAQAFGAAGYDLGPMTPDARKDFDAVDADIDAQLEAAAKEAPHAPSVVHDTDVPPKPSDR